MKSEYKKYDIYLKDNFERTLLNMRQADLSLRADSPMFYRGYILMKIKKNNINKAMKRLQLYKARNIEIQWVIEKTITEDYNEHNEKTKNFLKEIRMKG